MSGYGVGASRAGVRAWCGLCAWSMHDGGGERTHLGARGKRGQRLGRWKAGPVPSKDDVGVGPQDTLRVQPSSCELGRKRVRRPGDIHLADTWQTERAGASA